MVTQVRIYTINRGMLDSWIQLFNEKIVPTSARFGVTVVGAWVNRPQNEFIWVRTYADAADRDAKTKAFQDAAREAGVVLGGHVAKMEIREAEPAFAEIGAAV